MHMDEYIIFLEVKYSNMIIANNQYTENFAAQEGGALKFNEIISNTSLEKFSNNSARYGPDVAAYPVAMTVEVLSK